MKKFFCFLVTLLMFLSTVVAANAESYSHEYVISSYNMDLSVSEDNVIHVTENITADFNVKKHGIYRYIPTKNVIENQDGTKSTIFADVCNVSVNEKYSMEKENSQCFIQIGDEDTELTGKHSYRISYDYRLSKDFKQSQDALFYNLIGEGWDTVIKNFTFSIEMPKKFDENKISFIGYGDFDSSTLEYSINGNTVTGSLKRDWYANEPFAVKIDLGSNYFNFDMSKHIAMLFLIVLFPIIALMMVYMIWRKNGKDVKLKKEMCYYPPQDMNSVELTYWYKGIVTNEDTLGLLFELANDGYLRINQLEENTRLHDKNDYEIEKTKEYRGTDRDKGLFFAGLFKNKDKVYRDDLEDTFYKTAEKIVARYTKSEVEEKVFVKKSLWLRYVGIAVSALGCGAAYALFKYTVAGYEKYFVFAAAVVISIISLILSFFIRKRTEEGAKTKQQIYGFKLFLQDGELDRCKDMLEFNPKYFYDILPYAYVLGLVDAWGSQFSHITVEPPHWYRGIYYRHFVPHYFIHSFQSNMMNSFTSVSDSGSFSGGGSSGGFSGGVGGGGGGSW